METQEKKSSRKVFRSSGKMVAKTITEQNKACVGIKAVW
jgi:hypothetical protein